MIERVEQSPKSMPKEIAAMHNALFLMDINENDPTRLQPDCVPFSDLVALEAARLELKKIAHLDNLTGLLNRHGLDDRIRNIFDEKNNLPGAISGFSFDLNEFKRVNDRYGHSTGDAVMCKWVELIKSIAPEKAIFARTGGDEFVLLIVYSKDLMKEMEQQGKTIEDITDATGQRFAKAMNDSVESGLGESIPMTASIGGVSLYEPQFVGEVYHAIGKRSDDAMYKAKKEAKREHIYKPRIHGVVPSIYVRQPQSFFQKLFGRKKTVR